VKLHPMRIIYYLYVFIWEGPVQLKVIVNMSTIIGKAIWDNIMHEFSYCIKSCVYTWYEWFGEGNCLYGF